MAKLKPLISLPRLQEIIKILQIVNTEPKKTKRGLNAAPSFPIELQPESDFIIEERVCILSSDADLPFEWAEAVVKLRNATQPKLIKTEKWADVQRAASVLYNNDFALLKAIIDKKWSLPEIFGCHQRAPATRYDSMGLLLLLERSEVITGVTETSIKIKTRSNSICSFYKQYVGQVERVLLHELA